MTCTDVVEYTVTHFVRGYIISGNANDVFVGVILGFVEGQ